MYFRACESKFTANEEITYTTLHFLPETMGLCVFLHAYACLCLASVCTDFYSCMSLCVRVRVHACACVCVCICLSVCVPSQFPLILYVSACVWSSVFTHKYAHTQAVPCHGKKLLFHHISSKKLKQTIENAAALNRILLSPDWNDHIHHFGPSCY